MYKIFIKNTETGEKLAPKDFDKTLSNKDMNSTITGEQARYFKREIKNLMKITPIPKAPVSIEIDKEWHETQKKEKVAKVAAPIDKAKAERDKPVPVIEGQDPLAIG
jgi:hypothetical protein